MSYVSFNPLDIHKYSDVVIGFRRVHFKPEGLPEQVQSCNGLEHFVCYNISEEDGDCTTLFPVPCCFITCPVYHLRPDTKLPASTPALILQADEEMLRQVWSSQQITYELKRLNDMNVTRWLERCSGYQHVSILNKGKTTWTSQCSPLTCDVYLASNF